MAGKRPDQYQIAPGEARAMDYKDFPQVGEGKSSQDDTTELDKQKLARNDQVASETGPYNQGKPAPSVHANAPIKEAVEEGDGHYQTGAGE